MDEGEIEEIFEYLNEDCTPSLENSSSLNQAVWSFKLHLALYDQTQVDLKPDGQPEQASLNQCQLIAQTGTLRMPS